MKKSYLMLPLLAASLWSCSNDDLEKNGGGSNGAAKYMAISIATSSESGMASANSRADYEEGLFEENRIKSLDFFFFDQAGNAASVKADRTNYVHVTEITTGGKESENVEKTIDATIVINSTLGDEEPSQIVAVVNGENPTTYANKSITELQEALAEGTITEDETRYFTMSNSVFAKDGSSQIGVNVAGHLYGSETAALGNPVTIYVERVLAKVRMETTIPVFKTLSDGSVLYDTQDEKGYNDKHIYVKFLGWNTTATSTATRLVKAINPSWNPGWIWTTADYHRSFWAINHPDNEYAWGNFNTENAANLISSFMDNGDHSNIAYLKENAAIDNDGTDPQNPSQVIIAAQLVDEEGNAVEFAEWSLQRMAKDDLPTALANVAPLYFDDTTDLDENNKPKRKKILPSDIELVTAKDAGIQGISTPDSKGRYYVYGSLKGEAKNKTWYGSKAEGASEISLTDVQNVFNNLGGAKVWKNGYTYYYFDINHLNQNGTGFGKKGVVRNHLYAANVKSLKGLGTPVYKPEEIIYPEKPQDDSEYIAAQIKILSWRLVNFNIDLNW